jgi:lipopolysaccharide export system ATP-binding protein
VDLVAEGLRKSYRGRKVVDGVSLSIAPGEIVGLLGPNGAGKTTCFYMMVGLVEPDGGQVLLGDEDITTWPMFKRARAGVAYLAQEPSAFRRLDVQDNIWMVLEALGTGAAEAQRRIDALLEDFGLSGLRHQRAETLSGGERRRLEVARSLAIDPTFILLDEPSPASIRSRDRSAAHHRHLKSGNRHLNHGPQRPRDVEDHRSRLYNQGRQDFCYGGSTWAVRQRGRAADLPGRRFPSVTRPPSLTATAR